VNAHSGPLPGPVLVDVQATQSAHHRDRGVARYTAELASALWSGHPALVHSFLLNPDAAPPGSIEALVASGRLGYSDRVDVRGAHMLHICSPFELDVPIARLWPARAASRGMRLAVTLYDLIPEIFADRYLADPGLRRRYRARTELVRAADLVLAISESTAADAIERLHIPEERICVVGAASGPSYDRPASRVDALHAARAAVAGLEERFVLYTAGMDDRKNFQGLFRAWSRLPAAIRARWQLVMVCAMDDPTRNHLVHLAREVGIDSRLLLPGFVADEVLRLLYQSTDLFVFPSLYEGFGLPVAEALACGARVIGSGTSAVQELLDPVARFEPADDDAMAAAIARALTDPAVGESLDAQARRALPGWDAVADRTAQAYERELARPRAASRRRPLVAFVSPLPPAASGIADYSFRFLSALRDHCDIEAFADGTGRVDAQLGPPRAPSGVDVFPVRSLTARERARGGYDCVVYCVGNSEFHAGALAQLRRRSGVVLAHEVRLTDLYAFATDEPGAVPEGYEGALAAMYDGALSANGSGRLGPDEAEAMGVLMVSEIVGLSDRFAVMSEFAAERVRLDVAADEAERVVVVPFAMREPATDAAPAAAREPIVASFGVVHPVKQNALLVAALPTILERVPEATVAFVGPCSEQARADLLELAAALEVAERVSVTGVVDTAEYALWLDRAAVSVQLRRTANGESSAAVADCLGAGTAVVVTGIGAARDLPADAVVSVGPAVAGAELGAVVADLLCDPARRADLARAGHDLVVENSFAAAARRFYEELIVPAAVSGLSPVRPG
jgi:glycosyltransferase involved in cell wall biosynthesis